MGTGAEDMLDALAKKWDIILGGDVLERPASYICFGQHGADAVVVKALKSGSDEVRSSKALLHFGGRGAVRVLDHAMPGMLLERAQPGTRLTDLVLAGRDDDATMILCDVVAALHSVAPTNHVCTAFPTVVDWGRELAMYRATADATLSALLVDRAVGLFAELAASQAASRLLHGDLHHDNILSDRRRGWLAIDPKGVIGEPAYELGAALRNPTADAANFADSTIVSRRVAIFSEKLSLDRTRILAWAFAQAVLSAVWDVQDNCNPIRGVATAEAILPLL